VLADKQVDVLPVSEANEPDLIERTLAEQWQKLDAMVVGLDAVAKPIDVNAVFTDRFLHDVYAGGELK
jgi:hypothetical protein